MHNGSGWSRFELSGRAKETRFGFANVEVVVLEVQDADAPLAD